MQVQAMVRRAGITALGCHFPERVVGNDFFTKYLDTTEEWIVERTGIKQRRRVAEGEASSDLAAKAAREALESRGMSADEVDCIIVATTTPDMPFPNTACLVQEKIGAGNAFCFDLMAACSGYVYALHVANALVASGAQKNVLLIGVDVMSSILNYQDRSSCVLFGDGAAATLIEPVEDGVGIIDSLLRSDGKGWVHLHMPAGGSKRPTSAQTVAEGLHTVYQEGRHVFTHAVPEMAKVSLDLLSRNQLSVEDLKLFVPHQANQRIIEGCGKRMGIDPAKVANNIAYYANTTAATIPSCLYEASTQGRLQRGDLVQLTSFGAGFTWGSILLRWAK